MTNQEFITEWEKSEKALQRYAMKLTRHSQDAQDLVQEAISKAFKYKDKFREGSSFKSWSFTILKNTFINNYRKNKRMPIIHDPVDEVEFVVNDSNSNYGWDGLELEDLHKCISQLSIKSRMPLMMYAEGFKYDEIAERLNIPMGTVKSRINYARKKLTGYINQMHQYAA